MDLSRHIKIFDPGKVRGRSIAIIGVGSIGSALALQLAKLGLRDITLIDGDVVEPHTISNQVIYSSDDVGFPKVIAAATILQYLTGYKPNIILHMVEDGERLRYDYVFCCVDSMAARDMLFNRGVFLNGKTALYFEGRMNANTCYAYAVNPTDMLQVNDYRATLHTDAEVRDELGGCDLTQSVGRTASIAADHLTTLFMQWVNREKEAANEVIWSCKPWMLLARNFDRTP